MADSSRAPLSTVAATRLSGWLSHLGVSPMAFDDTLSLIDPLLAVHHLRARVIAKITETPSASTIVLQAGPAFHGLQAGQYVMIGVTIAGVRHRRAYSPRAVAGHPGRFAITVQRQPGGRVSQHIHEAMRVGDVIDIEQAAGAFTLSLPLPAKVLLMAGGSGITPSMAMLEHLRAHAPHTQVTLIYFARCAEERIFGQALQEMASQWSGLQYLPIDSAVNTPLDGGGRPAPDAQAPQQVLDIALLNRLMPNWSEVPAYCCGPAPLMDAARALWQAASASAHLHLEAFAPPKPSGDPDERHTVRLLRDHSSQHFDAAGDQTILLAGEQAGLSIQHGCRQGICHECTCRLNSGSVRDTTTGERIDGQGQPIRLCVSSAMSDLELETLN